MFYATDPDDDKPDDKPDDSDSKSSSDTNTGAIAGGVVGGVAGLALIAALLWFFLKRKRKGGSETLASTSAAQSPVPPPALGGPARELDAYDTSTAGRQHELPGKEREKGFEPVELVSGGRTAAKPVQLAEQHGVSELPG